MLFVNASLMTCLMCSRAALERDRRTSLGMASGPGALRKGREPTTCLMLAKETFSRILVR
eukprot:2930681-Rhodomonas_salina.1